MNRLLQAAIAAIIIMAVAGWIEPCDDSSGHSCKHEIVK